MNLKDLCAPFNADEIQWRLSQVGRNKDGRLWAKVLAYIDDRAIMNRLDEVCGPENWKNEFRQWRHRKIKDRDEEREIWSQLCGLSIRVELGPLGLLDWLTKWDGAEDTDFEPTKGGLSAAMKRAAVHWGIGRYLYDLPVGWATCYEDPAEGKYKWQSSRVKVKGGADEWVTFSWDPPELPSWALPSAEIPEKTEEPEARDHVGELRKFLFDEMGCKERESADAVVLLVTNGTLRTVREALQSHKNAQLVTQAIIEEMKDRTCSAAELKEIACKPD